MSKPTLEQLEYFYQLQRKGVVTRANFHAYLEYCDRFSDEKGFHVVYSQFAGIERLARQAVGEWHMSNLHRYITDDHFPLGWSIRDVSLMVKPYLNEEANDEAASRLMAEGFTLGDIGDLAGFLRDHPTEVEKWRWVTAINKNSLWKESDDIAYMPFVSVGGYCRLFLLRNFNIPVPVDCGVLVVCKS